MSLALDLSLRKILKSLPRGKKSSRVLFKRYLQQIKPGIRQSYPHASRAHVPRVPRRQHISKMHRPRAGLLSAQPHHLALHVLQRDPYLARTTPARRARHRHSADWAPHAGHLQLERQVCYLPPQHRLPRGEVALARGAGGRGGLGGCGCGAGPGWSGEGGREGERGGGRCCWHAYSSRGGERRAGRTQRCQRAYALRSGGARAAWRGHDMSCTQRRRARWSISSYCRTFLTSFDPRRRIQLGVRQPLLDVLRERLARPRVREAEHGEGRRAREAALDHHVAVEGEALACRGGAAAVQEDDQGDDDPEPRERAEDAADERGEVGVRAAGRGAGGGRRRRRRRRRGGAGGEEGGGPGLALDGWVMGVCDGRTYFVVDDGTAVLCVPVLKGGF